MPVCSEIALADMAAEGPALPVDQKGQKMETLSSPADLLSHTQLPPDSKTRSQHFSRGRKGLPSKRGGLPTAAEDQEMVGREDGKKYKAGLSL